MSVRVNEIRDITPIKPKNLCSRLLEYANFIKNFISTPAQVGSVFPSSSYLSDEITKHLW